MLKFQGSEFSPRMAREEHDYVLSNPHEADCASSSRLRSVDYGRIDYAMKDGRIQTWEINLNPTIGRGLRRIERQQSGGGRRDSKADEETFLPALSRGVGQRESAGSNDATIRGAIEAGHRP